MTWPKIQGKISNIFRMKRAFKVKQKPFFIIFKRFSVAKSCLRLESALLNTTDISRWWCKLSFGPLQSHVKSWHFHEIIDARRQYFYFSRKDAITNDVIMTLSLMTFQNSEKLSNLKVHELPWAVNELCTYLIVIRNHLILTKLVKNCKINQLLKL